MLPDANREALRGRPQMEIDESWVYFQAMKVAT